MKTKPCLTAADVKAMLAAAEAEAAKNKWPLAIAIVDDGGHLLAALRLDGATVFNMELALGKARTAAQTARPSRFWAERLTGGGGGMLTLAVPVMPAPGGLPVMVMGECVGGIAASGAKGEEDERASQAGLDALGS